MTAMAKYYGVREATDAEVAIYNKVENAFTNEEEYDKFLDLIHEEELDNLCVDRIIGKPLKALIKSHKLTIKEVCTWFFMD